MWGDETINQSKSECNKLVQKEYMTRHDWAGKVINWKLSKKFKFVHMNYWLIHNPESVPEKEKHKLLLKYKRIS